MNRSLVRSLAVTACAGMLVALSPVAGSSVPAEPEDSRARTDRYGTVLSILPPGQSGTIDAAELAQVSATDPENRIAVEGENAPPNFADQLEMYDAINTQDPSTLTFADLRGDYYKDAGFEPETVVREETPRSGVRIRWDEYGVPYVNGSTYANTLWGAGYAGTQDRMFLMDILRHTGAARMAEFVGGTEANLAMDVSQLRSAYYTPAEAEAQIVRLARRNGEEGEKLLRGTDAFLAGINAAQDAMCPLPTAPECPAEYAALNKTPRDWVRADLTYVASLVGGIFGKGGGGELDNAVFYQQLVEQLGVRTARRVYAQLRSKNDAEAPTTIDVRTPYGGGTLRPGLPGVAMPDLDGPTAPGTGHVIEGDAKGLELPAVGAVDRPEVVDGPFGAITLDFDQSSMSNAVLVGGAHTVDGHPATVFGPQTGYFTPQLLTEQVLVGPGVKARGVSFAATNLVVQLGRGVDYAWSATSASNDLVDTVVERLCNSDGSPATVRSTSYRVGERCVSMRHDVHEETVVPNPTAPTPPQIYRFDVWRTRHGIVQTRMTVRGKPVAIVLQRATYGKEVNSILGFKRFNDPSYLTDAESFQSAAHEIDYTFNWFYADDEDIAYYSSGWLPDRAPGVDFDLPRWGDRRFDWRGRLPSSRHPQQINPPSGYLVSWNNKPAPGFSAADDVWGYGSVYRSLALEDRVRAAIRHPGDVALTDVAALVADAATVDSRAAYTLPLLLRVIGDDARGTTRASRLLRAWLADGAHRVDRDRDGHYAHEAAIALFDTWWEDGRHSVAYDVVADRLGMRLTRLIPKKLDDHPRLGVGSAWNGVAWYGYLNKDLRQVLGQQVRSPYALGYCGRGRLPACRVTLRTSLRGAITRALRTQGAERVGRLTYDTSIDDIRHVTAGTVGVRPIDWQNRPTFQQVVRFTGHRPR